MVQGLEQPLQTEHTLGKVILCCHLVALKYSLEIVRIGLFPGNTCKLTHEDVREEQWGEHRCDPLSEGSVSIPGVPWSA